MIVIELVGGLCNQLYGFLKAYLLAKKYNQELKIFYNFKCSSCLNQYLLDLIRIPDLEKINYVIYNQQEKERLGEERKKYICLGGVHAKEEKIFKFMATIQELESCLNEEEDFWIRGFWTSDNRLLQDNIIEINAMLQPCFNSNLYNCFINHIREKNVVGIHIRRGDFIKVGWTLKQDESYYRAAIQWYKKQLKNCVFYIFSDDIDWAKAALGSDSSYHYITYLGGVEGDIIEFLCLAQCKYKVLTTGSSFSLLANDVNANQKKISILYGGNVDTALEIQVLANDNKFVSKYAEKGIVQELSSRDIEELSALYQVDDIYNGVSKEEIEGLLSQKILKKDKAVQWLKKCDEVSLNVYKVTAEELSRLKEKKFYALCIAERYEEANMLAYRLCYDKIEDKNFIGQYIKVLQKNQDDWAAIVEAARYKVMFGEESNITLSDKNMLEMLALFETCRRYSFLVYTSEKNMLYDIGTESVEFGLLLRRLGNGISFMFKEQSFYPDRMPSTDYVKKSTEYIIESYGIYCKCNQFLYTNEEESRCVAGRIQDNDMERICLVCTFDSFMDCVNVECKKIVVWFNESLQKEMDKIKKWIDKQANETLHKKVIYIKAEKKAFFSSCFEREGMEHLYKKGQHLYKLAYDILYALE